MFFSKSLVCCSDVSPIKWIERTRFLTFWKSLTSTSPRPKQAELKVTVEKWEPFASSECMNSKIVQRNEFRKWWLVYCRHLARKRSVFCNIPWLYYAFLQSTVVRRILCSTLHLLKSWLSAQDGENSVLGKSCLLAPISLNVHAFSYNGKNFVNLAWLLGYIITSVVLFTQSCIFYGLSPSLSI